VILCINSVGGNSFFYDGAVWYLQCDHMQLGICVFDK